MFAKQHFSSHYKGLFHVHVSFGRSFYEVLDIVIFGKALAGLGGNFALRLTICLVPHKDDDGIWLGLGTHLIAPVSKVLETSHTCHAIGQEYGVRATIEYFGNALERLLTCGVPYL